MFVFRLFYYGEQYLGADWLPCPKHVCWLLPESCLELDTLHRIIALQTSSRTWELEQMVNLGWWRASLTLFLQLPRIIVD